jgi:hypothetical protein
MNKLLVEQVPGQETQPNIPQVGNALESEFLPAALEQQYGIEIQAPSLDRGQVYAAEFNSYGSKKANFFGRQMKWLAQTLPAKAKEAFKNGVKTVLGEEGVDRVKSSLDGFKSRAESTPYGKGILTLGKFAKDAASLGGMLAEKFVSSAANIASVTNKREFFQRAFGGLGILEDAPAEVFSDLALSVEAYQDPGELKNQVGHQLYKKLEDWLSHVQRGEQNLATFRNKEVRSLIGLLANATGRNSMDVNIDIVRNKTIREEYVEALTNLILRSRESYNNLSQTNEMHYQVNGVGLQSALFTNKGGGRAYLENSLTKTGLSELRQLAMSASAVAPVPMLATYTVGYISGAIASAVEKNLTPNQQQRLGNFTKQNSFIIDKVCDSILAESSSPTDTQKKAELKKLVALKLYLQSATNALGSRARGSTRLINELTSFASSGMDNVVSAGALLLDRSTQEIGASDVVAISKMFTELSGLLSKQGVNLEVVNSGIDKYIKQAKNDDLDFDQEDYMSAGKRTSLTPKKLEQITVDAAAGVVGVLGSQTGFGIVGEAGGEAGEFMVSAQSDGVDYDASGAATMGADALAGVLTGIQEEVANIRQGFAQERQILTETGKYLIDKAVELGTGKVRPSIQMKYEGELLVNEIKANSREEAIALVQDLQTQGFSSFDGVVRVIGHSGIIANIEIVGGADASDQILNILNSEQGDTQFTIGDTLDYQGDYSLTGMDHLKGQLFGYSASAADMPVGQSVEPVDQSPELTASEDPTPPPAPVEEVPAVEAAIPTPAVESAPAPMPVAEAPAIDPTEPAPVEVPESELNAPEVPTPDPADLVPEKSPTQEVQVADGNGDVTAEEAVETDNNSEQALTPDTPEVDEDSVLAGSGLVDSDASLTAATTESDQTLPGNEVRAGLDTEGGLPNLVDDTPGEGTENQTTETPNLEGEAAEDILPAATPESVQPLAREVGDFPDGPGTVFYDTSSPLSFNESTPVIVQIYQGGLSPANYQIEVQPGQTIEEAVLAAQARDEIQPGVINTDVQIRLASSDAEPSSQAAAEDDLVATVESDLSAPTVEDSKELLNLQDGSTIDNPYSQLDQEGLSEAFNQIPGAERILGSIGNFDGELDFSQVIQQLEADGRINADEAATLRFDLSQLESGYIALEAQATSGEIDPDLLAIVNDATQVIENRLESLQRGDQPTSQETAEFNEATVNTDQIQRDTLAFRSFDPNELTPDKLADLTDDQGNLLYRDPTTGEIRYTNTSETTLPYLAQMGVTEVFDSSTYDPNASSESTATEGGEVSTQSTEFSPVTDPNTGRNFGQVEGFESNALYSEFAEAVPGFGFGDASQYFEDVASIQHTDVSAIALREAAEAIERGEAIPVNINLPDEMINNPELITASYNTLYAQNPELFTDTSGSVRFNTIRGSDIRESYQVTLAPSLSGFGVSAQQNLESGTTAYTVTLQPTGEGSGDIQVIDQQTVDLNPIIAEQLNSEFTTGAQLRGDGSVVLDISGLRVVSGPQGSDALLVIAPDGTPLSLDRSSPLAVSLSEGTATYDDLYNYIDARVPYTLGNFAEIDTNTLNASEETRNALLADAEQFAADALIPRITFKDGTDPNRGSVTGQDSLYDFEAGLALALEIGGNPTYTEAYYQGFAEWASGYDGSLDAIEGMNALEQSYLAIWNTMSNEARARVAETGVISEADMPQTNGSIADVDYLAGAVERGEEILEEIVYDVNDKNQRLLNLPADFSDWDLSKQTDFVLRQLRRASQLDGLTQREVDRYIVRISNLQQALNGESDLSDTLIRLRGRDTGERVTANQERNWSLPLNFSGETSLEYAIDDAGKVEHEFTQKLIDDPRLADRFNDQNSRFNLTAGLVGGIPFALPFSLPQGSGPLGAVVADLAGLPGGGFLSVSEQVTVNSGNSSDPVYDTWTQITRTEAFQEMSEDERQQVYDDYVEAVTDYADNVEQTSAAVEGIRNDQAILEAYNRNIEVSEDANGNIIPGHTPARALELALTEQITQRGFINPTYQIEIDGRTFSFDSRQEAISFIQDEVIPFEQSLREYQLGRQTDLTSINSDRESYQRSGGVVTFSSDQVLNQIGQERVEFVDESINALFDGLGNTRRPGDVPDSYNMNVGDIHDIANQYGVNVLQAQNFAEGPSLYVTSQNDPITINPVNLGNFEQQLANWDQQNPITLYGWNDDCGQEVGFTVVPRGYINGGGVEGNTTTYTPGEFEGGGAVSREEQTNIEAAIWGNPGRPQEQQQEQPEQPKKDPAPNAEPDPLTRPDPAATGPGGPNPAPTPGQPPATAPGTQGPPAAPGNPPGAPTTPTAQGAPPAAPNTPSPAAPPATTSPAPANNLPTPATPPAPVADPSVAQVPTAAGPAPDVVSGVGEIGASAVQGGGTPPILRGAPQAPVAPPTPVSTP